MTKLKPLATVKAGGGGEVSGVLEARPVGLYWVLGVLRTEFSALRALGADAADSGGSRTRHRQKHPRSFEIGRGSASPKREPDKPCEGPWMQKGKKPNTSVKMRLQDPFDPQDEAEDRPLLQKNEEALSELAAASTGALGGGS